MKILKKIDILLSLLGVMLIVVSGSCSVEKVNLSPLSQNFMDKNDLSVYQSLDHVETNLERLKYTSDLSNVVTAFPVFENHDINQCVNHLKSHISEYLYATQKYNEDKRVQSLKDIQNTYKKVQKYRKALSPQDNETLNFYLVKIKTNINLIEASKKQSAK
ncbi:hypothetical protein [Riemerella columbina]|uniref:hypothetical protein n=1 Tax=Riemerella columbina TaxID=103810 RepID=UPI00037CD8D4|nr:hypothetical protein [Riemerella columbina]